MDELTGEQIKSALRNCTMSIYSNEGNRQITTAEVVKYIEKLERRMTVLAFAVADKIEKS